MKTEVKVLADSVSPRGDRLTTLQVCFPRFILAEVNTHRVLSRNYRSSRAVPVAKLLEEVRTSPFIPSQFTKNQAGMQGGEALTGEALDAARAAWLAAACIAADNAEVMANLGVHKQYANRGLEPYLYVHGVISATSWDNFFALRCHPDAQPEFQELAVLIRDALADRTPATRNWDSVDDVRHGGRYHESWHLPYVTDYERENYGLEFLKRMSAARCAWVSYKPHDQAADDYVFDVNKINRTFDKLMSTPMHASPMEHVATPGNTHPANFEGWLQWRHLLEEDRRHG